MSNEDAICEFNFEASAAIRVAATSAAAVAAIDAANNRSDSSYTALQAAYGTLNVINQYSEANAEIRAAAVAAIYASRAASEASLTASKAAYHTLNAIDAAANRATTT